MKPRACVLHDHLWLCIAGRPPWVAAASLPRCLGYTLKCNATVHWVQCAAQEREWCRLHCVAGRDVAVRVAVPAAARCPFPRTWRRGGLPPVFCVRSKHPMFACDFEAKKALLRPRSSSARRQTAHPCLPAAFLRRSLQFTGRAKQEGSREREKGGLRWTASQFLVNFENDNGLLIQRFGDTHGMVGHYDVDLRLPFSPC